MQQEHAESSITKQARTWEEISGLSLAREQQRYRPQLERYAGLVQQMEQRAIRLGLYFPMIGAWREWAFWDE